jgi:hypothetical protein
MTTYDIALIGFGRRQQGISPSPPTCTVAAEPSPTTADPRCAELTCLAGQNGVHFEFDGNGTARGSVT